MTFFKDPHFVLGGLTIMFKGRRGLIPGMKRLFKTGKLDSMFYEMLKCYRNVTKKETTINLSI